MTQKAIQKIEWKREYEVGVQIVDKQHKTLVEIAGALYSVLVGDPQKYMGSLPKILQALADYTVYHFSTEERYMKKYSYPGAVSHMLAHKNFISELNNLAGKISANPEDNGIYLYNYVVSWLFAHIAKADKLLADFIIKKEKAA